ncbi:Neutral alpha-glucosidase AB, partial [Pseudolycoriella hygida]
MCLSVSVAGISFCGSDVGGFFRNPEPELLTERREPYLLPENERSAVRAALKTRYALLTLWYTMFYEHERYGAPVMRPMLAQYPSDINVFMLDDQYMLADKLLVRPVLQEGATSVNVYFPSADIWYDFDTNEKMDLVGNSTIQVDSLKVPVFQKGGSIIPKKEIARQSSFYMADDPVSLFVAVDLAKKATGTLYIDDERSYDYRRGKYIYLQFEFDESTLSSRYVDRDSSFATGSSLGRIVVAGIDDAPSSVTIHSSDGETKLLNVVNVTNEFFVIEASNTNLALEWQIIFNGAMRE